MYSGLNEPPASFLPSDVRGQVQFSVAETFLSEVQSFPEKKEKQIRVRKIIKEREKERKKKCKAAVAFL